MGGNRIYHIKYIKRFYILIIEIWDDTSYDNYDLHMFVATAKSCLSMAFGKWWSFPPISDCLLWKVQAQLGTAQLVWFYGHQFEDALDHKIQLVPNVPLDVAMRG